MFNKCRNSKKKGDVGLGAAIAHFTRQGICVCIPLTDSQDYDLVVEVDGVLKKIQVKTTNSTNRFGRFEVGLRVLGGNSKSNFVHKQGNEIEYDLLFVITGDGTEYLIPRDVFADNKSAIVLGEKYASYIVVHGKAAKLESRDAL